jgi:bacterioferritin-associated ferredoxin
MILCLCHRVADHDIADCVRGGCRSFEQLQDETRVATGCASCECDAREAFERSRALLQIEEPQPA